MAEQYKYLNNRISRRTLLKTVGATLVGGYLAPNTLIGDAFAAGNKEKPIAVRGVYSKQEEAIIAAFKKNSDEQVGWIEDDWGSGVLQVRRVATPEAVELWGKAADYWNPLWWDDNYARKTRWGGIIAFPFFQHYLLHGGPQASLTVPPEVGTLRQSAYGDRWDFYTPVRPGDTFKIWFDGEEIEDITNLDGKSPRTFRTLGSLKYINQKDEVTAVFHRYNKYIIVPPGITDDDFIYPAGNPAYLKDLKPTRDSVYTDAEIAAINRIADAEKIRGADPRYWEDVTVGDELQPVVQGPLNLWDVILNMQSFGFARVPMREVLRLDPEMAPVDPDTNIPFFPAAFHVLKEAAQVMGQNSTTIFAVLMSQFMGRLITNWMGDDGFLERFNARKFSNHPIGDTLHGSGRVIKKYRGENNAHLVDLACELETNRGNITYAVIATVSLPTRA